MPRRPRVVYTQTSCPSCGRRVPTDHRYNPFTELYGHRCPHGVPCPSFGKQPRGTHDCADCYQAKALNLFQAAAIETACRFRGSLAPAAAGGRAPLTAQKQRA